jgi:hypothetical protein
VISHTVTADHVTKQVEQRNEKIFKVQIVIHCHCKLSVDLFKAFTVGGIFRYHNWIHLVPSQCFENLLLTNVSCKVLGAFVVRFFLPLFMDCERKKKLLKICLVMLIFFLFILFKWMKNLFIIFCAIFFYISTVHQFFFCSFLYISYFFFISILLHRFHSGWRGIVKALL